MARAWYAYIGGDQTQPSSYQLVNVDPTCVNGATLCAIYSPAGGPNPSFVSSRVQAYIANALVTRLAQPQSPGAKKFVYLKN